VKLAATAIVIALVAGLAAPAKAQFINSTVVDGPYYNPQTKSYFELRRIPGGNSRWRNAKKAAEQRTYKGVEGRLAIVDDVETPEFLLRLPLKRETWIGLRLDCSHRELIWVDGSKLAADGFSAWNPVQWYRNSRIRCENTDINYMGVYYRSREQFQWQAAGELKAFDTFLVEYPTGHP
jgi:hypothetical protein